MPWKLLSLSEHIEGQFFGDSIENRHASEEVESQHFELHMVVGDYTLVSDIDRGFVSHKHVPKISRMF